MVGGRARNGSYLNACAGFFAAALLASLIYTVGLLVVIMEMKPDVELVDLKFIFGFAFFFWIFGGFGATLVLIALPWATAVKLYRNGLRCSAPIYFPGMGALLFFVVGCAAAAQAPKPLFIEDQTFIQGVVLAADRQGLLFLASGMIFGLAYWFLSERPIPRGRTATLSK